MAKMATSNKGVKTMGLLILVAGSILLAPGVASGTVKQVAGPLWGVDDSNTSTLNPFPLKQVSNIPGGQCAWINTGMTAFVNANAGWSYSWASQASEAKVEAGISILDYFAYVVTQPAVKAGNGVTYPSDAPGINDLGGAVFNIKYTPVPGAPAIADLHWVQAYNETTKGVPATKLDNGGAATPFYDAKGTAGTLAGGGGWFLDTPYDTEGEYEQNPVSTVQFQVVLADYDNAKQKVTLYGGEWWGYVYTATDTPEPSSLFLLGSGVLGMGCFLRRRLFS